MMLKTLNSDILDREHALNTFARMFAWRSGGGGGGGLWENFPHHPVAETHLTMPLSFAGPQNPVSPPSIP